MVRIPLPSLRIVDDCIFRPLPCVLSTVIVCHSSMAMHFSPRKLSSIHISVGKHHRSLALRFPIGKVSLIASSICIAHNAPAGWKTLWVNLALINFTASVFENHYFSAHCRQNPFLVSCVLYHIFYSVTISSADAARNFNR